MQSDELDVKGLIDTIDSIERDKKYAIYWGTGPPLDYRALEICPQHLSALITTLLFDRAQMQA